jgi:AcrR family transcriptional regulator
MKKSDYFFAMPDLLKTTEMAKKPLVRAGYHHGDLPDAMCRAFLELVLECGADKVKMADVARRAGVSAGAPYRHFRSLDELMVATALKVYERFLNQQRGSILGLDNPQDKMLTFATYFFVFAAEDPAGFALLFDSRMSLTHRELDHLSRQAFDDAMAIATELAPKTTVILRTQFVVNVFALIYGNSKLMVEHYSPVTAPNEFPAMAASGVSMLISYLCAQNNALGKRAPKAK